MLYNFQQIKGTDKVYGWRVEITAKGSIPAPVSELMG